MNSEDMSILYIESNTKSREALSKIISKLSVKLYTAKDATEGFNLYKFKKIDIVISALRLNKRTSINILKKIRTINKDQLIIFTITQDDSNFIFKAMEFRADYYITETFKSKNIQKIITKAIHHIKYKKSFLKLKESEEKFRQISQTSQMGIFIYKEKYVYANDAFCKMIGYCKDELYQMNVWDIMTKENKKLIKDVCLRRLKGEHFPKVYQDLKIVTKSGEIKINRITTDTISYENGYAGLGTTVDITDIKGIKERLNLLAQAMEQMDEMVRITDKQGKIIYVNEATTKYTFYKKSELIGKSNHIFKSNQHSSVFYDNMWETILSNRTYQSVFINLKKNGELYYEDQTITPIVDDNDEVKYFVSTSKDVTSRIEMENRLKLLATTDGLTRIYNRYKINLQIEDEINRINRYKGSFTLIMFDIDFFKNVNDKFGHDVGDNILIELSKIISGSLRDTDKFGRWGGEEFMVLAPELNKKDSMNLAQKLRQRVQNHNFNDVGHITISLGVTTSQANYTKEMMLKDVDNALYKAKNNGRNMVVSGNT